MNIDAATNVDGSRTGVSFMVHDEFGNFLAAKSARITGFFLPRVAEALFYLILEANIKTQ